MNPSEDLVAFRRTAAIGLVTRLALIATALVGSGMLVFSLGSGYVAAVMFAGAAAGYLYLGWKSVGVSRRAMIGPELLARGQLEDAEQVFTSAVRTFTLFPVHRVVELMHLAQLRHRQGRFLETAQLTREVIGLRGRVPPELALNARLLHLEALLDLRAYPAAHEAIVEMLPVAMSAVESARFVLSRTRYESAIGAEGHVLHHLGMKLQLVKLLPPEMHARFCLLGARAAAKSGREDLAMFLSARAEALLGPDLDRAQLALMADTSSGPGDWGIPARGAVR